MLLTGILLGIGVLLIGGSFVVSWKSDEKENSASVFLMIFAGFACLMLGAFGGMMVSSNVGSSRQFVKEYKETRTYIEEMRSSGNLTPDGNEAIAKTIATINGKLASYKATEGTSRGDTYVPEVFDLEYLK